MNSRSKAWYEKSNPGAQPTNLLHISGLNQSQWCSVATGSTIIEDLTGRLSLLVKDEFEKNLRNRLPANLLREINFCHEHQPVRKS